MYSAVYSNKVVLRDCDQLVVFFLPRIYHASPGWFASGKITSFVSEGRAMDVFYDDFSNAFNTVSHSIIVSKLGWLKNWSGSKVVFTESSSTWKVVTRGISQGSVLRAVLFIIFINDLEEATECHSHQIPRLHQTWGRRGETVDTMQIRGAIQRDQLEEWANRKLRKFNKDKYEVLHLGRKQPWLGTDWRAGLWIRSPGGQQAGHEQQPQQQRTPTVFWAVLTGVNRLEIVIIHFMDHIWNTLSSFECLPPPSQINVILNKSYK